MNWPGFTANLILPKMVPLAPPHGQASSIYQGDRAPWLLAVVTLALCPLWSWIGPLSSVQYFCALWRKLFILLSKPLRPLLEPRTFNGFDRCTILHRRLGSPYRVASGKSRGRPQSNATLALLSNICDLHISKGRCSSPDPQGEFV